MLGLQRSRVLVMCALVAACNQFSSIYAFLALKQRDKIKH